MPAFNRSFLSVLTKQIIKLFTFSFDAFTVERSDQKEEKVCRSTILMI